MPTEERPKDPARVKGGQERQKQLRAALGDDGYRRYQHTLGAQGNAAQPSQWTPEQYRQQRRDAYAAAVAKYGVAVMQARVRAASEARRRWRVSHPSAGERMLRELLRDLGLHLLYPQERFDLLTWRVQQGPLVLSGRDALVEGSVGLFDCDVLIPLRHTAIEFLGGVHALQPAHDERRRRYLERQGLTVIELTQADFVDTSALRTRLRAALGLGR